MGVLDKISGFLTGDGPVSKIVGIFNAKAEGKISAQQAEAELRMFLATSEHEIRKALIEQETAIALEQSKTNQIEAQSSSLLQSGWRPMTGWVCVSALGYQMVIRPLVEWISINYAWMPPPSLELDTLLTLLFALLGLGAYRTYEKTSKT